MGLFRGSRRTGKTKSGEFSPVSLPKSQLKRATRTRDVWAWTTSFCLFVTVIFLIIVEIGNTYNKPVLRNIWFIRLDLSNVVPLTVPGAALLNSIARTLGLHDFYQVGLWNYCEGYGNGVTDCTHPRTLYWFDPIGIIKSQLIAGARIALPNELQSILDVLRIASHWMFGLFLTGACLSFVLMFVVHTAVHSRWIAFAMSVLTFLNALFTTAATVIATAIFIVIRNVLQGNSDVNIGAKIGVTMFVCMWFAAAFSIFAFVIQLCLSCCCASRRDVTHGFKKGSKKAYL